MDSAGNPPLPAFIAPRRLTGRRAVLLATVSLIAACSSPRAPSVGAADDGRAGGDQVALMALSMIGKPYVWGGQDPDTGFDCSGLVRHVYEHAAGLALPRTARQMAAHGSQVPRRRLVPGDLLFFNTGRRRNSHVGIYVGEGRFVHAPGRGKAIRLAEFENPYWQRTYNGARRPLD